ncbi:hypothetical protein [Nonomuraea recticatena]|uniref:Uncharacterized protein n=1 Tax=Nonomuraea recticatena TaxID=46178 RepID=A0ABN3TAW8_9ACTN
MSREDYVNDLVTDRLIGFEIQVALYAAAELRIRGSFQRRFAVETVPADNFIRPRHGHMKLRVACESSCRQEREAHAAG